MTTNFMRDIEAFHEKYNLAYWGKPRVLPGELGVFRYQFMSEEAGEWFDNLDPALEAQAVEDKDVYVHHLEQQLDAIVDLLYVTLGTAYLQGFNEKILTEAWDRVHAANMSKVRATSVDQSKRGSTQDVVKPKGWEPPYLRHLVEDCQYED